MNREVRVARTLIELTDVSVDEFDVSELLTRLAQRSVEVLGVDAAGVMLVEDEGGLTVAASSDDAVGLLQAFEERFGEGPAFDCYRSRLPVAHGELAGAGSMWPRFAARAAAASFRSVQALPVRLRGSIIGVLTLLRTTEGLLETGDVLVGQAFAAAAAIAVFQYRALHADRELARQLGAALESRAVIEQATGVIAEAVGADMEYAFTLISEHALTGHAQLVDVAAAIVGRTLSPASLTPFRL